MKFLCIVLFLAAVAGLEFFHEFSSGHGSAAAVCTDPQASRDAVKDVLMHHLQSHR